jgi:hypothetical protein
VRPNCSRRTLPFGLSIACRIAAAIAVGSPFAGCVITTTLPCACQLASASSQICSPGSRAASANALKRGLVGSWTITTLTRARARRSRRSDGGLTPLQSAVSPLAAETAAPERRRGPIKGAYCAAFVANTTIAEPG